MLTLCSDRRGVLHCQTAWCRSFTMKLQPASREYRHPRVWIGVRVGSAVWLIVLAAILWGLGQHWWGALLLAPAALQFYFVYLLAVGGPYTKRVRDGSTT